MIERENFLMDCVVCVASDDYENFESIFEETGRLAGVRGIRVTESEVADTIERAIANGLVEAFLLSPHEPYSLKAAYSAEQLHRLWFYITPQGKSVVKSIPELSGEVQ